MTKRDRSTTMEPKLEPTEEMLKQILDFVNIINYFTIVFTYIY